SAIPQTLLTVALIGNPNTGKSTLFNTLAGIRQRVGNYPGVTVEKKTGLMDHQGRRYELIDLPGLYSLAPRSRDEMVAVDVLLGRGHDSRPADAVVCIVDASNLQRNLYLASQVLELRLPTVLAVNMLDVAEDRGLSIDVEGLERQLGIPVVAMQANRGIGVAELRAALSRVVGRPLEPGPSLFPEAFEEEVSGLRPLLSDCIAAGDESDQIRRYLVRRLLLDMDGYLSKTLLPGADREVGRQLQAARDRLSEAGCAVPGVETEARYGWIGRVLEGVVTRSGESKVSRTDRIDRLLTHPVWGMIVFAVVMVVVFQSVFAGAGPFMAWIDGLFDSVGGWVESAMAEGALRSLLVKGVIGGVGGVVAFLPQILILFLFIAVLEDCGYMARAAYLMDKMMVRVGLNGKSFIPMLASFACAVPGIMAARVIENERDRLVTILVAPLMTCSARLPIFAVLIGAFIPRETYFGVLSLQGLTLGGLYALGILSAVVVALLLKRTILRGQTPSFVMELPSYKRPSVRTILARVAERGWVFLHTAGTIILAVSIIVWAALYFPHNADVVEAPFRAEQQRLEAELAQQDDDTPGREALRGQMAQVDRDIAGAYQRQSLLGRAGRLVEPVFRPLGWDWRISCAVIASFPAREVVVATLSVTYNLGEDVDTEPEDGSEGSLTKLEKALRSATLDGSDQKVFNIPVALSIMVFFTLCAQCAATLAVIRRETNSWRWPLFTFGYMTALAYLGALVTYQLGMWIGGWAT
ncbi:ferrous iron transport protein B, partial [Planctomycetota bacterium]